MRGEHLPQPHGRVRPPQAAGGPGCKCRVSGNRRDEGCPYRPGGAWRTGRARHRCRFTRCATPRSVDAGSGRPGPGDGAPAPRVHPGAISLGYGKDIPPGAMAGRIRNAGSVGQAARDLRASLPRDRTGNASMVRAHLANPPVNRRLLRVKHAHAETRIHGCVRINFLYRRCMRPLDFISPSTAPA